MSIFNRRNAVVGWATWAVVKQFLKRDAKAAAAPVEEETRRPRTLRRKEPAAEAPVEPKKKKGKRRVIGFVVATGVGVGAWLSTRGRKPKDDLE